MKVIFLDIDGVLNSERSRIAFGGYPWPGNCANRNWNRFDDVAIGLLQNVVKRSGAVCVLSSSWREGMSNEERNALSERLGVPIIDSTRRSNGSEMRGEQIADWLKVHPEVDCWAILDDSQDMRGDQRHRFVHVNGADGFSLRDHARLSMLLEARP